MRSRGFGILIYLGFIVATLATIIVCVAVGSVFVPLPEAAQAVWDSLVRMLTSAFTGGADAPSQGDGSTTSNIIVGIRLPRILTAGLVGGALALSGCAMQGLLKNPLADGSTLGVSAGASLGAVIAISLGFTIPLVPFASTTVMAALFALLSLVAILSLAFRIDRSLSTNTIILIGIIFSMFASALISVFIVFASDQASHILFWTMGSLASSTYSSVALLGITTLIFGGILMGLRRELNAFALGEENARHIGVDVKRVKLLVLICAAALIGACVSVGGTIAFVGLVTPHMVRMLTGPNHTRLLPASFFGGAVFLMLSDLAARTVLSPRQLPIGVVTSLVGAALFIHIFFRSRKGLQ